MSKTRQNLKYFLGRVESLRNWINKKYSYGLFDSNFKIQLAKYLNFLFLKEIRAYFKASMGNFPSFNCWCFLFKTKALHHNLWFFCDYVATSNIWLTYSNNFFFNTLGKKAVVKIFIFEKILKKFKAWSIKCQHPRLYF